MMSAQLTLLLLVVVAVYIQLYHQYSKPVSERVVSKRHIST